MPLRFFRLADDVYVPHRWHLDTPKDRHGQEVDYWQFRLGVPVHIQERLRIPVEIPGKPLDFTEANVGLPVVHVRVASLFAELASDDVQLLPVDVEGQPDQYLILVATRRFRCIDEQASRIRLWTHENGVPHMVGQYMSVRDMRIDKSAVGTAQVFRCEGWEGPLIVSEAIKDSLEKMGATGTRFEEV
ncbi:MAG: imm11 family protein [Hyalangium sp.]|uniref:imm11 family protein n=1 Tax=Hyalangium sp. TaxID=2028555 RepID=UPI00389B35ED